MATKRGYALEKVNRERRPGVGEELVVAVVREVAIDPDTGLQDPAEPVVELAEFLVGRGRGLRPYTLTFR